MDEIMVRSQDGPNRPADPVDEMPAEGQAASLSVMDAKLDLILSALGIDLNEVNEA